MNGGMAQVFRRDFGHYAGCPPLAVGNDDADLCVARPRRIHISPDNAPDFDAPPRHGAAAYLTSTIFLVAVNRPASTL